MKKPDHIRNYPLPLKLTAAGIIALLILGWLGWDGYTDYQHARAQFSTIERMDIVRMKINYLDEVLTMSTRMAAATGNLEWETRYRSFEPELTRVIEELIHLDPEDFDGVDGAKTDTANAALVIMENHAFELVRQGKIVEAQQLLSSEEYNANKKIYAESILAFNAHLVQVSDSFRTDLLADLYRDAIIHVFLVMLVLLVFFYVFVTMHHSRTAIMQRNLELDWKTAEMEDLNRHLDLKVSERTIELQESVLASLNMMEDAVQTRESQVLINTQLQREITVRKAAETKVINLNRVYAMLSGVNTAIVRIRERQELFNEVCRIAVEVGQLRMAWIGLLSPDRKHLIPQASSGHEAGYLERSKFLFISDDTAKMTASGRAVVTMRPSIHNNIDSESDLVPLKMEALARGYYSIASFPLIVSQLSIGVISLYASEPDFFDQDEIKLLVELASDISYAMEFMENERRLAYLAYHDPLTGLVNRTSLYHRLGETISDRGKIKQPFALLLININAFRNINDTLGHHNGDELIRQVAKRLQTTVWESDTVAGLGGDDFAILLPRLADKDHIDLVIAKVLQSFQHPYDISNIPVNVEVTLGIALYPDHGDSANLLWQHADIALRAGKEQQKTHIFYDPAINHYDPVQLALIGELRRAIDQNELVLHYQPKIDLLTEHTIGVEALIRWQHPVRGLIFPDKFIPLIENTGLIDSLTIWVMANAFRQVHFWHKNGFPLDLSVNLSARNLQNPHLKNDILDLTRSSRFPLNHLTVEITESAIMVDPAHAKAVLKELRDAGIVFSVDDFGIGQTSLSYLKELPISNMKIDKSFVMDIKDPSNLAIVRSAIELGHNLNLSVTAEGVEDEHAYQTLKELGCDKCQGYYFSKPLPPDQFIAWLRKSTWKIPEK